MKNRSYRQVLASILSAALMLSVVFGPLEAVKAEETEVYTESQTETLSEAATEPTVEVVTETTTEPAANSEPETVKETEPETGTEAKPVTETEGTTETEAATESESSTETAAETEPVTEPESPAETETVTEGETSGESETETEPVTEKETETQKAPQAQVQSVSPAQNQILMEPLNGIDEAVQNVQTQIDALPTAAEVGAMSQEKQQSAYIQAQNVWDAYDALTEEQQVQVDASKLTELLDYFNGQVAVTAGTNEPTASTVAEVVMNGTTTYYDTLNEAVQTVSNAGGTATITLLKNASLTGYNRSPIFGNITFIGGNYTISGDNLGIMIAGTLTVMSGTFDCALLYSAGTINIYGGNYDLVAITSYNGVNGTANIYGGTFEEVQAWMGTMNIYGGSIRTLSGTVNYPVTNISLSSSSLTLAPETSQSLTATISPEIAASHVTVSWSSSNENVAKISGNGTTVTVTAGTPGAAKITASAGGQTATCQVTVSNPAPTMELTVKNGEGTEVSNIAYGLTVTLEANVTHNNQPVTDGTVDFYRGTVEEGNKLNDTPVSVNSGTASADIQITGESWKPNDTTSYSIIAVYTPAEGGSVSGGSKTASLKVDKATPDALPDGPNILKRKTTTSVTLNPVDNDGADIYGTILYGYITGDETSVPEDRWQNSNEFTNLSPGTDYNFFTRYAGNDYYNPSNRSYFGYLITTLPSITTTSLISGYVGVEYKAQLAASVADNKTVTWTLANGATLPDGLTLDAETGVISGVPKATATSHSFTVQASIDGIDSYERIINTATLSITINAGTPDIRANTYNGEEQTDTFNYGDTITVSGTIAASATAPGTSTNAITQNQVGLYLGNTELATADVDGDGSFALTYDTSGKSLSIGENQTLTVRYGGSSTLNSGSTTVQVTLNKKPVTVTFTGTTEKDYDGHTSAPNGLTIALSDGVVVGTDDVTATAASVTYEDAIPGTDKTITASGLTLSGNDAGWYTLFGTTATTTGTINKASQTPPASGVGYTIDYAAETISAESGYELARIDTESSGGSSLGLTPGNDPYSVYIRFAETSTHSASPWTEVTIPARPSFEISKIPSIDYTSETISTTEVMEYSVDGGRNWKDCTADMAVTDFGWNGTAEVNVLVRLKAVTEGSNPAFASAEKTVSIPARPETPSLTIDNTTESITVAAGQEYRIGSSNNWTTVNQESSVTVEPNETIHIRVAATDSSFRSTDQSLTAPARAATPNVPDIDFTEETVSTAVTMEYRVGEKGSWEPCTDSAMDLEQYFGWNGTDKVDVYFRTAATNSSYASDPTQALTIPARPIFSLEVSGSTASSLTVTASSFPNGAEVSYQLVEQGGTTSSDPEDWQENGTFTGLKAGVAYAVYARCSATNSSFAAQTSVSAATNGASYTVSIPSQAEAGGNPVSISITEDETHPFDLGNGGQVNVKIIDDENIDNGVLTLTREGASNTVTSALSVNGTAFTDLKNNVATFTEANKASSVSLSFAAPTGTNIPAGTYTGTVNFEISYSQ